MWLFSEEDYDAFCLAYMFTYRDFEGGTLGLAWTGDLKNAGGVCEKNGVNLRGCSGAYSGADPPEPVNLTSFRGVSGPPGKQKFKPPLKKKHPEYAPGCTHFSESLMEMINDSFLHLSLIFNDNILQFIALATDFKKI